MQGIKNSPGRNHEGYMDSTASAAISNVYKGDYKMTGWNDGDIIKMNLPDGRKVYRVILKAHKKYATTLSLYDDECPENEYKVKPEKTIMHADLGRIAFTKSYDLDSADFIRAMEEKEFDRFRSRVGEVLGIPAISVPEEEPFLEERKELREQVEELTAKNTELDEAHKRVLSENVELLNENKQLAEKAEKSADAIEKLEELGGQLEQAQEDLNRQKADTEELELIRGKLRAAEEEMAMAETQRTRAEAERDVYKELYMQVLAKMGISA